MFRVESIESLIAEEEEKEKASGKMTESKTEDMPGPLPHYARLASAGHGANGERQDGDTPDRRERRSEHNVRFVELQSTEEMHEDADEFNFYGPFSHIRKQLDSVYHVHYNKYRQWFQDSIIEDLLDNIEESDICTTPVEPWLIYTAGAHGAGKLYTVQKLVESGRLPLLSYVFADPDEIRRRLPEFEVYLQRSPSKLNELTEKESGYITELVVHAALQTGRNVILDGALRDYEWWNLFFDKVRKEYPMLKVALLHITAPRDVIMHRLVAHSLKTGREIPQESIDTVLEKLPQSIEAVAPNVDYFCTISNTDTLKIVGHEDEDWDIFTVNFLQACAWQPGQNKHQFEDLGALEGMKRASIMAVKPMRKPRRNRRFSTLISSEMNHKADQEQYFGAYSHIRKTLDYSYHCHYTRERQSLQDAIITDMLNVTIVKDKDGQICTTPAEPWLVFTAGAMGCGKGYTMNKLVEMGRFPLLAFVSVDPDEIRRHLPEFHLYCNQSPELAGELTRKEAGFISEILALAGLQAGKNVLVDGSLRDSDWYQVYFKRLRDEFPNLRLAILHVTAPREAVFQRAASRAIKTGRVVPQETLIAAIEQVPRSVKILSPLVDYFAELDNDPATPEIELTTGGETWEHFESQWVQTCAWIPSRRKFLRSAKASAEKLAIGGRETK